MQVITPAIILFAQGLEKVTTFIKNTVLAGFRFIVDQLNKLPFVDIQADLDATGGSFDAMAVQIETAGAMSDDATPKVKATGDAIEATGKQSERNTAQFNSLVGRIKATTEATGGLAMLEARVGRERVIRTAEAAKEAEATAELGRRNLQNAKAAQIGLTASQARKLAIVMEDFETNMASSAPPVSALDQAIADMTTQITEAQTAADLNSEAFAALSPELMAAAAELGLFGQTVSKVGDAAATHWTI